MTSEGKRPAPDRTPGRSRDRIDEVFGEVLPETTADERDSRQDTADRDDADAWYHENRPPHHGD